MGVLELFDLFATYNIAGVSQEDSFEESLHQLDKTIIPFLEYHFNGVTDNYTPRMEKRRTVVKNSRDEGGEMVSRGGTKEETKTGKLPQIRMPGKKKPTESNEVQVEENPTFMFVENLPNGEIRVYGGELSGIKPTTKLSLMTAEQKETTTFNGGVVKGEEIVNHGELKFERYEGDFSIFSMDKKQPIDVPPIINNLNQFTELYLSAEKVDRGPFNEERKFSIIDLMDGNKLMIAGNMAADGLKKNAQFSLVRETVKTFHDPNEVAGAGIVREEMASFKLVEDRNDFLVIEMNKGKEVSLQELLGNRKSGERYFVLSKLKHY